MNKSEQETPRQVRAGEQTLNGTYRNTAVKYPSGIFEANHACGFVIQVLALRVYLSCLARASPLPQTLYFPTTPTDHIDKVHYSGVLTVQATRSGTRAVAREHIDVIAPFVTRTMIWDQRFNSGSRGGLARESRTFITSVNIFAPRSICRVFQLSDSVSITERSSLATYPDMCHGYLGSRWKKRLESIEYCSILLTE